MCPLPPPCPRQLLGHFQEAAPPYFVQRGLGARLHHSWYLVATPGPLWVWGCGDSGRQKLPSSGGRHSSLEPDPSVGTVRTQPPGLGGAHGNRHSLHWSPPVSAPLWGRGQALALRAHRRLSPQPSEGCPVHLWLDHRLLGLRMEAQAKAEGPAGPRWPRAPCGQASAFRTPGRGAFTSWHHPLPALAWLLSAGVSGAQYLELQVRGPLWASVPPNPQPAPRRPCGHGWPGGLGGGR